MKIFFKRSGEEGLPASGGIPFARGQAPRGSFFRLKDFRGKEKPAQFSVLAEWPDRSVRWLLIDAKTPSPPGNEPFSLVILKKPRTPPGGAETVSPVKIRRGDCWILQNGQAAVEVKPGGMLAFGNQYKAGFTMSLPGRKRLAGRIDSLKTELKGPLRTSILAEGAFYDSQNRRYFGLRVRVSLFSGCSKIRLEPMVLFDRGKGVMHRVKELGFRISPLNPGAVSKIVAGTETGRLSLGPERDERLFQLDDRRARKEPGQGDAFPSRSPGYAILYAGRAEAITVVLKNFWQKWPKSLEAEGAGLLAGLLPRFEKGDFDHMRPRHKYNSMFEKNCYRIRTGQVCRWDIWIENGPAGPALASFVQEPPVITAGPLQMAASGQFGFISAEKNPCFDEWAGRLFRAYIRNCENERNYGQMNFGDWHGERGVNWGNNEYDTPKQFLLQFARTSDPEYHDYGIENARHMSEVDVINFTNEDLASHFRDTLGVDRPEYPVRPGMVHQHTLGHVSGHFPPETVRRLMVGEGTGSSGKTPYLCLDPRNLGHIWTGGLCLAYFLTGDGWFRECALRIGDNLAKLVENRRMKFSGGSHSGRQNGWTMLALGWVWMLEPRRRWLKAMKTLADEKLREQDPVCGGWLYEMPRGHCNCAVKKHVGEAGFITGVMVNGLSMYYRLSGDKRIPGAVQRAVSCMNNTTWNEVERGWRYTPCPASGFLGQFGTVMEALANSADISGDPVHRRILEKAWQKKVASSVSELSRDPDGPEKGMMGKNYSTAILGCLEVLACLGKKPPGRGLP